VFSSFFVPNERHFQMAFYTYYVKADFWGKMCYGSLVKIVVSNKYNKLVIAAASMEPRYSGEVKMVLLGKEVRMDLLNKEGCYIISNERHCPQDSVAEMYKKLVGNHNSK